MNLFRSEEHVKRWPLHFQAADEYVMSVADWAEVFSASMFRNRLDPDYFVRECLRRWSAGHDEFFAREAVSEYIRCFRDPGNVHSACEDYRAGASIDLEHDEEELGRVSGIPLLVVWGAKGRLAALFDVPALWEARFSNVRARPLPCGHFLVEELPDETSAELLSFLGAP